MGKFLKAILVLLSMFVFWCFAETFLVTEKPRRRKSVEQLRQQAVELLGSLIELDSALIEKSAQRQQQFYRLVQGYAQSDKKTFLYCAGAGQLEGLIGLLEKEKELKEKQRLALDSFLVTYREKTA